MASESPHRSCRAIATSGSTAAATPWNAALPGFLLLPGDGLLLASRDGLVEWVDRTLEPRLAGWRGASLSDLWPDLHGQLEGLHPSLEHGPLDLHLPPPAALTTGEETLSLRLFLTDTGLGVAVRGQNAISEGDRPLVELLTTLLNTVEDALLVTLAEPLDLPGPLIVYANQTLLRQSGYRLDELLGRTPRLFQGPQTDPEVTRRFGRELRRWGRPSMEVLNYTREGQPYWNELKVAPLADGAGWFTHWVSVQRDVSERRAGEQALAQQVLSDPLTGLPNRRGLIDRLERALSHETQDLALIFCDLDRFKEVNDRYGHAAGDALLLELTNRLQTVLRSQDTLARLGGDEFVVLVEQLHADEDALTLAERLRASLAEPWHYGDEELTLSMSMGVALGGGRGGGRGGVNAEELLRRADLTMYQVKAAGRNGVAVYTVAMDQQVQQSVSMRQQLEQALRRDRFLLHYQPMVNLESGAVVGAEALVRLHDGDGQLVQPDAFIPVAERTGLIVPMERWVLAEALDVLAGWQRQGQPWHLAINVSPQHLERGHLAEELLAEQARTGVDLAGLTVEITETVLLQAHARAHHNLTALRAAGVSIALDDFGTGYSSLAWLSQLPIDQVKIDQSYIRQMDQDPRCATLVRGFVRVFQELGLRVVAEGIETVAQRQALLDLGCVTGQGYLFGRPSPLHGPLWASLAKPG